MLSLTPSGIKRVQQGCTAFNQNIAALSHVFFAEAERLYIEEKTGHPQFDTAITTVAATQILSLTAGRHGKEEIAQKYLRAGIQLAHQNGLLEVGKGGEASARKWLDSHISIVKAAAHTAWGTFCTAT